jgi:prepilin-type N-terminal cleavage/methylation domain-containing protein
LTRRQGFTLIELIIVVAIIGNLLDSMQKAKQRATLAEMRSVGLAWFSWLTDEVSAAAAGSTQTFDFATLDESLTSSELLDLLFQSSSMFYIRDVPTRDGWGHPIEYSWSGNVLSAHVMGIRSMGRDGLPGPSGDPYTMGPFTTTAYDEDIVWLDGFFVRYPTGAKTQ